MNVGIYPTSCNMPSISNVHLVKTTDGLIVAEDEIILNPQQVQSLKSGQLSIGVSSPTDKNSICSQITPINLDLSQFKLSLN